MKARIQIAALALSAIGFVGIVSHEGYTDTAVQPLPGDKWTQGFGSTTREDGAPVRPGDKTNPVRALLKAHQDIEDKQDELRACLGPNVSMYPHEWDFSVSLAYNVGTKRFCDSTIAKLFREHQHEAACRQIMRWTYYQGKDCKDRANNCYGLVLRRQQEMNQCLGLPSALH